MAEVWLAKDTFLHRDVAVKLLKPHLANDEDAAERFRREAKACAGIAHPNIVAVYDCLDYQGQQAVVMQYVKGKSLRDILDRQKRLGPKLTVHIGVSIAAALRVRTPRREIRQAPTAMNTVSTTGNSSGSIDMPIAIPARSASIQPPRSIP